MVTFLREQWRPKALAPEEPLCHPIWALIARTSKGPWLSMEVFNGRSVDSVLTSSPPDAADWLRLVGPRHLREVSLMVPDARAAARWNQVAITAIWQVVNADSGLLYFEDKAGTVWHPLGRRCSRLEHAEATRIWTIARVGGDTGIHEAG